MSLALNWDRRWRFSSPVTLSAHVESNWQGVCHFTRESGDVKEDLEITIGKEDPHACPQGSTKLVALWNEAAQMQDQDFTGRRRNRAWAQKSMS